MATTTASQAISSPPPAMESKAERVSSIDALRGFDMFWIAGGEELVNSLHGLLPNALTAALAIQFTHVDWVGFHAYDLIFPLFLFLVGVVLPFSLGRQAERGTPRRLLYWRAARRLALLLLLGLVHNGLLTTSLHDLRLPGVLQRIAVCYFIAALVVIHFKPRGQAVIAGALLLGYWAIMAGDLTPAGNLSAQTDLRLLPRPWCCYTFGDNEGVLSTIPAIATALLGALAGAWLKTRRTPSRKAAGLACAGVVSLAVGLGWSVWFPIIKNIWTSSYVLFAAGWSLLLLALFYWIMDVRGRRRWAFFFVIIGMNPITIYVLRSQVDLEIVLKHLGYGDGSMLGVYRLAFWRLEDVAAGWLILWGLYRKRWFLRV